MCYDRSGDPGQQPFAVQCTSLANLDRVAQNRKFEAIADKAARQAAIDAAEKDGTRVKPEFGSVWLTMNGPDKEHARIHTTVAVPGATAQSMGLPDNNRAGRRLDHECGHVDRASHDSRQLTSLTHAEAADVQAVANRDST